MNETAQSYLDWKNEHDDGYVYDEIFDFCAGLSRGEMCEVMDTYLAVHQPTEQHKHRPGYVDGEDMYTMKTGAIAAFLDNLGVKGNLHGPAVNLLAILNGLDEKSI